MDRLECAGSISYFSDPRANWIADNTEGVTRKEVHIVARHAYFTRRCSLINQEPRTRPRMSHSVRGHLRLEIDEYDATIRRWIPGYEQMLRVASEAVASVHPARVVDLGAGTGALSEALLEREEVGSVVALDVDPEMLQRATERVKRFGERARSILRSFHEPFEPGDAFAASLSLHHIPTLDAKAALFRRVFVSLPAGGVLVNADCCMPEDPGERQALFEYWAEHQMAHGIPEERAWAHFEEWSGEDTYLPLQTELTALRDIGFEADRIWNDGPIGVVVARKPSEK